MTSEDITGEARRAIEAMLLVASEPTGEQLLAQVVELPVDEVAALCRSLADDYERDSRGFQLVKVAGGWQYQTHPELHPYVERYALEGIPTRLSNAALETMAIVAYKQPISRAQIGAIRGVNVDGVLRTLEQRGYVEEVGRDDGPGQAVLFGTTSFFLEKLGLNSIDQLPALGDFVPSAEVVEALEQTLRVDEPEVVDGSETESGSESHAAAELDSETDSGSESHAAAEADSEPVVDLDVPPANTVHE